MLSHSGSQDLTGSKEETVKFQTPFKTPQGNKDGKLQRSWTHIESPCLWSSSNPETFLKKVFYIPYLMLLAILYTKAESPKEKATQFYYLC